MKTSLITAALAIAAITVALALSNCTLSLDPNGNPSVSADPATAAAIADAVAERINQGIIDASK